MPEEVRRAADLLERRWTVTILWAAHEGAVRFNEFRYACGPIPPRTLAERLSDLQRAGVGERDEPVIEMNRDAMRRLEAEHELVIVPGATHLFEEPGALEEVARLARAWFARYLAGAR